MTKPACANCRFSRVTPFKPRFPEGYDTIDRECRFHPPERDVGPSDDLKGYFPGVADHQWCGKHQWSPSPGMPAIEMAAALLTLGSIIGYSLWQWITP